MATRENPWNLRRATAVHELEFARVREMARLTQEWLREAQAPELDRLLRRAEVREEDAPAILWIPKLAADNAELESFLDDTLPAELVERLKRSVRAVQAIALRILLERAPSREKELARLEQASLRRGREAASEAWPELKESRRQSEDARHWLAAFAGTHLGSEILVIRATQSEARLEMRACAHRSTVPEEASMADDLCRLHSAWMRGFLSGLCPRALAAPDRSAPATACRFHWRLGPAGKLVEAAKSAPAPGAPA